MATRTLPVRIGDVDLLVETTPVAGSENTSSLPGPGGRIVDAFDRARDAVVEIASSVADAVRRMGRRAVRPERVEVEFGLKFSAQGTIVVAGASSEASLLVRITYPASAAAPEQTEQAGQAGQAGQAAAE